MTPIPKPGSPTFSLASPGIPPKASINSCLGTGNQRQPRLLHSGRRSDLRSSIDPSVPIIWLDGPIDEASFGLGCKQVPENLCRNSLIVIGRTVDIAYPQRAPLKIITCSFNT